MRLAFVGTGMIAQSMLKVWRGTEGLDLRAVCSRDMARGEALASAHGIPRVYDAYDRLLADGTVDTVYLALPNSLHFPYAKRAMLAGKHVIVEKPFTSNDRECAELIALRERQGVFLWEAITTLHLPLFQKMRELLPEIGPVRMIQSSYCRVSSRYDALLRGEVTHTFSPEGSGGALMDINIYNLHLAVGLMGAPCGQVYMANTIENGVDTSGVALLRYPNAVCVCSAAKDASGPMFTAVLGAAGSLYLDATATQSRTLRLTRGKDETVFPVRGEEDGHLYQLVEFIRQLETGDVAACVRLLQHTQTVMTVATALRRSAAIRFPADG